MLGINRLLCNRLGRGVIQSQFAGEAYLKSNSTCENVLQTQYGRWTLRVMSPLYTSWRTGMLSRIRFQIQKILFFEVSYFPSLILQMRDARIIVGLFSEEKAVEVFCQVSGLNVRNQQFFKLKALVNTALIERLSIEATSTCILYFCKPKESFSVLTSPVISYGSFTWLLGPVQTPNFHEPNLIRIWTDPNIINKSTSVDSDVELNYPFHSRS